MLQQHLHQQQLQQQPSASMTVEQKVVEREGGDAPPKQVALAMDRLGQAARLIADVRLGADRFLEALLAAADPRHPDPDKPLLIISNADKSVRQHLHHLLALGRQLEESGVLNRSLRSRSDNWGLHMPLVCPDSSVVAYAWKRQLAGQAGASAVERTRLALKAFTEQKKRFFPHLEDETGGHRADSEFEVSKRHCHTPSITDSSTDFFCESRTLSDVLSKFEKEAPNMKICTYQRLDWLRRASSLSRSSGNSVDHFKESNIYGKIRSGSTSIDQVAIIELHVPSVFRAVLSLHPAGSINPSSVAFFSPDEGGDYLHSRGTSIFHVFKHITLHADKALQYFQNAETEKALDLLLHWIYGYHTLFSKVCSKCRHLIVIDKSLGLLMPPICHPYLQPLASSSSGQSMLTKDLSFDQAAVYHFGCRTDES